MTIHTHDDAYEPAHSASQTALSPLGDGQKGSLDQNVRDLILIALRNLQGGDSTVEKLAFSESEIRKVQAYFLDENKKFWGEGSEAVIQPYQAAGEGNTRSVSLDTDLLLQLIAEIGRDNVRLHKNLPPPD